MSTITDQAKKSTVTISLGDRNSTAIQSLIHTAKRVNGILLDAGLSARLTCENLSFIVGKSANGPANPVEFVFASHETYQKLVKSLRLYDFATAFFDEKLNVIGPFTDAIDVMYSVHIASDKPRTSTERLKAAIFQIAKATIPFVALRFESDAHYSMSAEAYRLFLDEHMQYTCGKFVQIDDDLDGAQANKFRLIEQLAKPYIGNLTGLKHLDIGCGWGGLIAFFKKHFFTDSIGNTNSRTQKDYAEHRYGAKILFGDFSELGRHSSRYDLITIIGMAEHLTPSRRSQLFRFAKSSLSRQGLLYFQCIARPSAWIGGDAYRLAYKHVFPGHYLESRREMERRFAELGFEIVYAADDAADYAKTTALWAERLGANHQQIAEIIGESNFRIFISYLTYASKLFAMGRGSLMRYMLRKAL